MKISRATSASFLVLFAATLASSARPAKTSVAAPTATLAIATLIPSRDVIAASSSVALTHAKRGIHAPSLVSSRGSARTPQRTPQRLSAPDVASRAEQHAKSAASSTRLVAAPASATPVRVALAPAVSDDVVQNYLAMNKPAAAKTTPTTTARNATSEPKSANFSTPKTTPKNTTSPLTTNNSPTNVLSASAKGESTPDKIAPAKTIAATSANSKSSTRIASPVVVAPRRDPAVLSSRHKDRILLAQLEADLMRAGRGLDRADETLRHGQKQLMSVGATLRKAMLDDGADAKGLHPFVRVAMRYAGTPYVWGGESHNGFDCSGFVIVVMRDLGYRALPHSAAEQFSYGTAVAQELLKPGDLVFFKNTYKQGVSHVGIYLGRRRFINAAGTGKGTIVSSLDDPFWVAHYAGARRLHIR